ncbi:MAG TPA: hypothetical protein VNG90_05780 [Candidatus Acidoferrum sp.]|nr:hypothetical protein [Candidatus Acidoferrum sp.]
MPKNNFFGDEKRAKPTPPPIKVGVNDGFDEAYALGLVTTWKDRPEGTAEILPNNPKIAIVKISPLKVMVFRTGSIFRIAPTANQARLGDVLYTVKAVITWTMDEKDAPVCEIVRLSNKDRV